MSLQILWIILGGAFGGLIKAIFDGEHKLAKPVFKGRYFYLGFLGNIIIGIGTALLGMGYFLSMINDLDISRISTLQLLAVSIAFGIASNLIIEGVIEKVRNNVIGKGGTTK
ncbi:hypothetical protein BBF96_14235 [Anoxybacter fermentans]|uniref:Uncharacterized protein n=1 Tax=Anoxybacter fermentans TaxID=1323375 RepID=A0A3Q9HU69_9FIRM|nr:DUF4257 domain-containing protein [Anoxybacter fermentans]AZR74443.1 hypothetical protein BBF96_14235 [Anoxybacter fermentans]